MIDLDIASKGADTLQAEPGLTDRDHSDVTASFVESPLPSLAVSLDDVIPFDPRDHYDVTVGTTPSAIFPCNVDHESAPQLHDVSPAVGEFLNVDSIRFYTPDCDGISPLPVFERCYEGSCDCCHFIGDVPAQLKPCRAASYLFGPEALSSVGENDKHFLWKGHVQGFKIVDDDCEAAYACDNYDSITSPEFSDEMTTLLEVELSDHKVSYSDSPSASTLSAP